MTTYLLVAVVLEMRTPGGIAAPEQRGPAPTAHPTGTTGTDSSHVPLARTPEGHPHVPASSLAGALRAHLGPDAARIMGSDLESEHTTASRLWFLGTHVEQTERPLVRMSTAVDRDRAAAATSSLRSVEYLDVGSHITIYLQLDDTNLESNLLHALTTWRPVVGGGRTTGHGIAEVVELRQRRIDLDTPDGLRAWLTESGPALFARESTEAVELPAAPVRPPWRRWQWEIVDGLHIGSGLRARQDDPDERATERALVVRDGQQQPYVPGTTWKGVLRSRCEFILRTLGASACSPNDTPACGTCLICTAFGYSGSGDEEPGRRGPLVFFDSPIDNAHITDQVHVALDRVFGGAATTSHSASSGYSTSTRTGLLYSREIVTSGTLTLEIATDADSDPGVAAMLTLACLDLHDGYVGIGGSTTRGLGTLRLLQDPETVETGRADAIATLTAALSAQETASPEEVR